MRTTIAVVGLLLLGACGEPAGKAPEAAAPVAPVAATPVVEGDAYRGSAIAQHVCVQCHDVGVEGLAPKTLVGAPTFRTIAKGDGATAASLSEWMRTSHPAMPNFIFDEASVSALSAYIMSLRTTP